jgi:hypothetical protein
VIIVPFAEYESACDNTGMSARRLLNLLIALSMAEDTPCCPHEQKSKDCQDCPLLGFCLIKSTQLGPMAGTILLDRTSLRAVLPVMNDAIADGLERPPPDHPPRILV